MSVCVYGSSHTEELWYNETVHQWMTIHTHAHTHIHIYIYIYTYISDTLLGDSLFIWMNIYSLNEYIYILITNVCRYIFIVMIQTCIS